jgi:nucleolar GTP-binding protein
LLAAAEESAARAAAKAASGAADDEQGDEDSKALLKAIRDKKKLLHSAHHREQGKNRAILPRTAPGRAAGPEEAKAHLTGLGHSEATVDKMIAHATVSGRKRGRSVTRRGAEEEAAAGAGKAGNAMDEDDGKAASAGPAKRARSSSAMARSRSRGASPSPGPRSLGFKNEAVRERLRKASKHDQRVKFYGTMGESDRAIPAKMPKHLFSGKRGIGSADWR